MILKIGLSNTNNYISKFIQPRKTKSPKVDDRELGKVSYYQPIFRGGNNSRIVKKLLTIENVHCPVCGVSLLTKNKYAELIATKCKTASDIAQLLRKNKRYVQPNVRGIITHFEELAKNHSEMNVSDAMTRVWEDIKRKKAFWLHGIQKDVKNTKDIETIGSAKINAILETYRRNEISYEDCKNGIIKLFEDINSPELKQLCFKIRTLLKEMQVLEFVISAKDTYKLSDDERVAIFMGKLFKNSLTETSSIMSKVPQVDSVEYLECTSCHTTKNFQHAIRKKDNSIEKNIIQYFLDIYKSNVYDKSFLKYFLNFITLIKFISKYKINPMFAKSDKFKEIKAEIFKFESPSLDFALSNTKGIPCACCGTMTLTYEEKEALNMEIKKTKDLFELKDLLEKKSIYCKDAYKVIFERYNRFLEANPTITDTELIYLLREATENSLAENLNETKVLAKTFLEDEISENDRNIYLSYLELAEAELTNYEKKQFPIKRFFEIFESTFAKLEDRERRNHFYVLKELLYNEFKRQFVIYPPHRIKATNKSDLKDTMAFIFTRSSNTVDHIHAKSKAGENEDFNYMVLCKDCNQAKKNFDFSHWIKKNDSINVRYNLQKYLNVVYEKIKELKIDNFLDYPWNFARQVRKETNHSVTLKIPKDE